MKRHDFLVVLNSSSSSFAFRLLSCGEHIISKEDQPIRMSCQGKMNEVNAPRVSSFAAAAASSCMCHSSGITAPHHGRWWMDKTKPKSKHNPKTQAKSGRETLKKKKKSQRMSITRVMSFNQCWAAGCMWEKYVKQKTRLLLPRKREEELF